MRVVLLHCWYGNPRGDWYPWLKSSLERKGYQIEIPQLMTFNSNLPNLKEEIERFQNLIDRETIVIGHSLGAVLALRIAEENSFKKLFLVSGWDFDDLTKEHRLFWKNKINHRKIRKNVGEIYVFHSDSDPYFTAFQAEEMSKRLGGKFFLIKGAGHFTKSDGVLSIPEIVKYL